MSIRDQTRQYQTPIFTPQGGRQLVISDGGEVVVEEGARIVLNGGTIVGEANGNSGTPKSAVVRVTFANEGVPVPIATIPANSLFVSVLVRLEKSFNDSGTDILRVGTAGSPSLFAASNAGQADGTSFDATANGVGGVTVGGSDVAVQALYEGQNDNASEGIAVITVTWIERAS